ncbi:MAG: geranylgeranylglycerol-phosphate geranylgeranyltransferase [Sulfolobales archaeon]
MVDELKHAEYGRFHQLSSSKLVHGLTRNTYGTVSPIALLKKSEPGATTYRKPTNSLKSKLSAYLELIRPHNVIAAVLCVVLGILTASRALERPLYALEIVIASAVVAFVSAGGYVINDYFDYKVDLVNKPYRPIPSGRVSPKEVFYFSLVLGFIGISLSIVFGIASFVFVLLNSLLVYSYSAKIKEWGIVGNVVVSFEGGASILYGSLVVCAQTGKYEALASALVPITIAFTLLLGREIVKTIEDYHADSVRGVRSLPRTIGLRKSALVASAILFTVPALSILPLFSGLYNASIYIPLATFTVIIVVASALKIIKCSNIISTAIKVRSALKIAIMTGILALLLSLLL